MGHTDPERLKGHSFRQIKALTGNPTKMMDSIKADAVVEPERRGKRDIFTFRRWQDCLLRLMRQSSFDETESMEGEKDDVSARLQNAVALGMIMVTSLRLWGNMNLAQNWHLLLKMIITGGMSATKQLSRLNKFYLGRISVFVRDPQGSKS